MNRQKEEDQTMFACTHVFRKLMLLSLMPIVLFALKMESGTVTLPATTAGSSTWQSVTLQQTYDTPPLIFALTTSRSNPYDINERPAALRVNTITTTGFEITQVEPMESSGDTNGSHDALTIHYLAIERGAHLLSNGARIIAGEVNTTRTANSYENITFPFSFNATPVVLGMVQSLNNEENTLPGEPTKPLLTTAIRNVTTSGLQIALERSKVSSEGSVTQDETIGYLAIEGNIQSTFVDSDSDTILLETIITPQEVNGWDDGCEYYSYANTYTSLPSIFANTNSRSGSDGGWVRECANSVTQAGVTVDEDIYGGSTDRTHPVNEIVGMLVFSKDFTAAFPEAANDDLYTTEYETTVNGNVLENDSLVATTTLASNTTPTNGTLTGVNADGSFSYTPDSGFVGIDSFTYTLSNGLEANVTILVQDPIIPPLGVDPNLIAEYRMDLCGFDGTSGDVIDNTINRLHGTSYGDADTVDRSDGILCKAAAFDGDGDYIEVPHNDKLNFSSGFTVSFWVYMTSDKGTLVSKMHRANSLGWDFEVYSSRYIDFDFNGWSNYIRTPQLNTDTWYHITGVYDPSLSNELVLYVDGSEVASANQGTGLNNATSTSLTIGSGGTDGWTTQDGYTGQIDEVKIFDKALTATEISNLYTNESNGRNWYDSNTTRTCNTCLCTAAAGSNLVSFAADFRNMSSTKDVSTMLGTYFTGSYGIGNDWELVRRGYYVGAAPDGDNHTEYYRMPETGVDLEYGKAYWILNRTTGDINYSCNLKSMDFNASYVDYPSCQAVNGKCVIVELEEPNGTDNEGPYIFTMTSFPIQKPIKWADVRILIDGVAHTPDQAEALGNTFSATIWKYDQDGNNYTSVAPDTPGVPNTIEPCRGYWIELDKNTAGKRVQLLIPQE